MGYFSGASGSSNSAPTGPAGGDLAGNYPNPQVSNVPDAAIPANVTRMGNDFNGPEQLVRTDPNGTIEGYLRSDGNVPLQGDLNVNGHALQNVSDPINSQDAANKNYVDLRTPETQEIVVHDPADNTVFTEADFNKTHVFVLHDVNIYIYVPVIQPSMEGKRLKIRQVGNYQIRINANDNIHFQDPVQNPNYMGEVAVLLSVPTPNSWGGDGAMIEMEVRKNANDVLCWYVLQQLGHWQMEQI